MTSRLKAFLKDEPLLNMPPVSMQPHLAVVVDLDRDSLTQKEEEACNRATD